jgi:hypothetical protein
MAAARGFYSIIQFVPDLDRAEGANIGVVLSVPSLGYLDVKMAPDNEAPKQRFRPSSIDEARLDLAKEGIVTRILREGGDWKYSDDLVRFANCEGNHISLLSPRTILTKAPAADLEKLFRRLIHIEARHRRTLPKPTLDELKDLKFSGVPLRENVEVELPKFKPLVFPFAYKNGALNLILPEAFPLEAGDAEKKASELAVKGHILHKRLSPEGDLQKLVVIGAFHENISEDVRDRIGYIFEQQDSRLVQAEQMEEFTEEVRQQAH